MTEPELSHQETLSRESPFWREGRRLTTEESKELAGMIALSAFCKRNARKKEVNLDQTLLTEFHRVAYKHLHPDFGGKYRRRNDVVIGGGIELCDWAEIPREMKWLFEDVGEDLKNLSRKPESVVDLIRIAAKIHNKTIFIHPFPDGNGRVARAAVCFLDLRYGFLQPVWQTRGEYLDAIIDSYHRDPGYFELFLAKKMLQRYNEEEKRYPVPPKARRSARFIEITETKRILERFVRDRQDAISA